jgi:hypothetical protein
VNSTGNQTINFILFQHQRAENYVIFQLFAGNGFGHALALTQLNQTSNIAFTDDVRIDDFDTATQFNALSRRNAVDLVRVTQQDTGRDAAFSTNRSGFNGTRLVAFRQNNAFACFACQLSELVTEGWRRETAAALGSRAQGVNPLCIDVTGNVFLNVFDTFAIVNRNFQIEALQAQRGLPGVGVHHKYRQAGSECTFTQLANAGFHFIAASQQQSTDSTPFIAARQAATSTSRRSAEVTSREPGRKCSSMCGMLRAQKVTDFTRRVLMSPSLTMVAFK